jgi:large subunit ribosomal protein L30e
MAKKKEIDKNVEEINKNLGSGKAIIGANETLKNLRHSRVKKIFLSSNLADTVKEDIVHYADITKTEVVELNYPNDELGALCKKPFSVSVVSILN